MVSFRQTPRPPNYLSRRQQWRLLWMVMALGLVVVLMIEAGDPERWRWLAALESPDGQQANPAEPQGGEPIDTRVPPPGGRQGIPGTFRSPASVLPEPQGASAGRFFPGVRPELLQRVQDDKLFRPAEENDAWLNLLRVLQSSEEQSLRRASHGRVTFAQLFKQSNEYRGELVTLRGTVRRAHRIAAPKIRGGPEYYYKLWLFPDDAPSSPVMVYCLSVPRGFPTGMQLEEKGEVAAFYFKRCVYSAVDSYRRAPMLAARTLHWQPAPPPPSPPATGWGGVALAIGVAAVFSLLVVLYVWRRTAPAPRCRGAESPELSLPAAVEQETSPGASPQPSAKAAAHLPRGEPEA